MPSRVLQYRRCLIGSIGLIGLIGGNYPVHGMPGATPCSLKSRLRGVTNCPVLPDETRHNACIAVLCDYFKPQRGSRARHAPKPVAERPGARGPAAERVARRCRRRNPLSAVFAVRGGSARRATAPRAAL
jgi:hypothetical protein